MSEVERILDQLKRAFEGEAWHGPSVMTILEGITAHQAAVRPLSNAHSICELILHMGAWERAGVRRLSGDRAYLSDAEDWPTVEDMSESAWQQTRKMLKEGHDELQDAISKLDDSRLDQPIVEGLATVYVTLHGIIQHTLYHAGQIAILKKAIKEGEKYERTGE
jgi:uncharacterized damage-inducible protein DinB